MLPNGDPARCPAVSSRQLAPDSGGVTRAARSACSTRRPAGAAVRGERRVDDVEVVPEDEPEVVPDEEPDDELDLDPDGEPADEDPADADEDEDPHPTTPPPPRTITVTTTTVARARAVPTRANLIDPAPAVPGTLPGTEPQRSAAGHTSR